MIQIRGINKSYGAQRLFEDASFTVNQGEKIGLVGRNGHGKTTLFHIILGAEHADSGEVFVPAGYSIGHLSQHLNFSASSVLDEASQALPPNEEGTDETYKAESVLRGLGFSENELNLTPTGLSGGYQVRLNLAKVILSSPGLLLLDEPTNYLDIVSMRWLARFLRGWKRELIIITHDREFMDSVTTHTIAIHRCGIRKVKGPTSKVYAQLLQEEEIYEKTRANDEKKRREAEKFINRFRAKATKARAVQSRIKALEKQKQMEKLSAEHNLDFSFRAAPFNGKNLIEADSVSFGYDEGKPPLIDGLSLFIQKRDRIAIIGKNGKGKTTLLNLLAGELTPTAGRVRHHPHIKPALFAQTNVLRLNMNNTVEEEIMNSDSELTRGEARGICGLMMFPGDHALKNISVLSGGEKSRVLLGKLLVRPSNILLLDEPTNHLDMESTESLLEAINAFEGAVVIVTHSEMILEAAAERLIVFDDGRADLFEGTYRDFLRRRGWSDERDSLSHNDSSAKRNDMSDRKQLRRMKAEIINERSRTLGALQKKIADIESEIMHLEEQMGRDNQRLLDASTSGNGQRIKELSKAVHSAKTKIEELFSELEITHSEYERSSREFEQMLDEIK